MATTYWKSLDAEGNFRGGIDNIKELIEVLKQFQEKYGDDLIVEVQNQDWGWSYYWSSEIYVDYNHKTKMLIL